MGDVGYSILFGGNKYLGYTNSSTNFANTTTEPTTTSTSYLWTPSTSGITNVNYTARTIADGGSDFRPYSEPSSGIVYLYKRIESGSTTYYSTTATCCTELGTINGSILWTAVFYCINAYKLNS